MRSLACALIFVGILFAQKPISNPASSGIGPTPVTGSPCAGCVPVGTGSTAAWGPSVTPDIKRANAYGGPQNVTQSFNNQGGTLSNGTDTVRTYRSEYFFNQYTYDLRICYTNATYATTLAESGPGNAVTLTAGLEYSGSTVQVTFGGAVSISVPNGGEVCSDVIPVEISAATVAYTRIALTVTSGNKWLVGDNAGSGGSYSNNGSDLTTGTGALANVQSGSFTSMAAVSEITGSTYPATSGSLYIVGDSIAYGARDNLITSPVVTGNGYQTAGGYILRGLGIISSPVPYNFSQLSVGGTSCISSWNTLNAPSMIRQISSNQYAISAIGTNDLASSVSAIKSCLTAIWTRFSSRGIPVYQTTLLPKTTSSDEWRTVGNQTVTANEATRVAINDWIRTIPAPLTGYIEEANVVEVNSSGTLTQDGGFWYVPGSAQVTGTLTSAGSFFVTDSGKSWTSNQWTNYSILITGGTGSGQSGLITSNTATTLNTMLNFSPTPDATSTYTIQNTGTADGTHPYPIANIALSAPISTWAAATLSGVQ